MVPLLPRGVRSPGEDRPVLRRIIWTSGLPYLDAFWYFSRPVSLYYSLSSMWTGRSPVHRLHRARHRMTVQILLGTEHSR